MTRDDNDILQVPPAPALTDAERQSARLTVAENLPTDEARTVLDMLGLL